MADTTVDFIAFDDDRGACLLVLVEEGWEQPFDDHLRSLQDRLYGCVNAALDGQVAALFPKSAGLNFIVQVDCYNLPTKPVTEFVERFAAGLFEMNGYSPKQSNFVRSFKFEVNHDSLAT
ncbi:DUF6572 domain-containing protein [Sphingomonas kyungheensis]|uniref:DUF6572 domain-containing protein n=1 Tax=Sphingomonas kyungheensis TaxID=1069987 RepID=A0ABU8H4A9_9SPHN